MPELEGRVALVTGGGRGLGAAVALALAEAGADVAVLGRNAATLDAVAEAVGERGRQSVSVVADVANWDEVRAAVAEVEQALGPVAILVNNAGTAAALGALEELDPAVVTRELAVDLHGPFYGARATLPGMRKLGWGRIINVTSGAATNPIKGVATYSVAKAGLNTLTAILATETQGTGIVPIAVSPGMMDTDMQAQLRAFQQPETDFFRAAYARGYLRPVEEPAALIRWLCGPEGEAFAGQVVSVGAPEIRARVGLPALPEAPQRP